LTPFGEQYVTELASTLLAGDGTQASGPIVESLLAKAKADAEAVADGARLDHIGRNVDSIFRTTRGLAAQLKDSRALVQVGQDFRMFDYLTDYRDLYKDRDAWEEVTDPAQKRSFFLAAREPLERVNASFGEGQGQTIAPQARGSRKGLAGERSQVAAGDDLTLIVDIDTALARRLHARGVTRYSQIAAWTSADIEQIDAALGLRGRIRRGGWIGQAKSFISRYERCGVRGHVYDALASPHCSRCPAPVS